MNCACQIDYGVEDEGMLTIIGKWIEGFEAECCECSKVVDYFLVELYITLEGKTKATSTCRDCWLLRDVLCCGYTIGGLWGDIENCMEDFASFDCNEFVVAESCMSKLSPGARARLCSLLESHWDELDENCRESE